MASWRASSIRSAPVAWAAAVVWAAAAAGSASARAAIPKLRINADLIVAFVRPALPRGRGSARNGKHAAVAVHLARGTAPSPPAAHLCGLGTRGSACCFPARAGGARPGGVAVSGVRLGVGLAALERLRGAPVFVEDDDAPPVGGHDRRDRRGAGGT